MTARVFDIMDIEWAAPSRRGRFVAKVVADCLQDLERIYEYEDELRPVDAEKMTADVSALEILWGMFGDWAAEAQALLARLESDAALVEPAADLRLGLDRVRARLTTSPRAIGVSMAMAATGNLIKGEDVRRELRDRVGR